MSESARKILKRALLLPEADRAELASELLDSLPRPKSGEERSDEEWIAEVERRASAAFSGSAGLSWEEARARVSDHLRRK